MSLRTLKPATKAAFTSAGVSLTPEQEHVAAQAEANGFNWLGLLQNLGKLAMQVLPIIIAIFGGQTPPTPAPAQAAPGCCDHHACCCATLKAILHAAEVCSKHMCQCCC